MEQEIQEPPRSDACDCTEGATKDEDQRRCVAAAQVRLLQLLADSAVNFLQMRQSKGTQTASADHPSINSSDGTTQRSCTPQNRRTV